MASDRDLEAVDGWSMAQIFREGSKSKPWNFELDICIHWLETRKSLILILTTTQKTIYTKKNQAKLWEFLALIPILDLWRIF